MANPRTNSPFLPTVPQVSTPFVDPNQLITPAWHLLLIKIYQNTTPGAQAGIALTGSPQTYVAQTSGTLIVNGLTGHVTLSRAGGTPYTVFSGTDGTIPLAQGDTAVITYTGSPTIVWFPG